MRVSGGICYYLDSKQEIRAAPARRVKTLRLKHLHRAA
jgi:hypothetical protein